MTFAEQQQRAHIERQRRLGIRSSAPVSRPPTVLAPPLVPQAEPAPSEAGQNQIEALQREIARLVRRLRAMTCEDESPLVVPSRIKPVICAVAKFYGVSTRDLVSGRRTRELVRPRQVAMYIARTLSKHSLPAIGRMMDRDHTTIMHGCRQIEKFRQDDPKLDADIRFLIAHLAPPPHNDTSS